MTQLFIGLVSFIVLFNACKNSGKGHLTGTETINGVKYTLIESDELHEEMQSVDSDLKSFLLRIGRDDGLNDPLKYNLKSKEEYFDRVYYYSYLIGKDIYLLSKDQEDTTYCTFNHFERSYGYTPYINLILSFDLDKNKLPDKLVLRDKTFLEDPIQFEL